MSFCEICRKIDYWLKPDWRNYVSIVHLLFLLLFKLNWYWLTDCCVKSPQICCCGAKRLIIYTWELQVFGQYNFRFYHHHTLEVISIFMQIRKVVFFNWWQNYRLLDQKKKKKITKDIQSHPNDNENFNEACRTSFFFNFVIFNFNIVMTHQSTHREILLLTKILNFTRNHNKRSVAFV